MTIAIRKMLTQSETQRWRFHLLTFCAMDCSAPPSPDSSPAPSAAPSRPISGVVSSAGLSSLPFRAGASSAPAPFAPGAILSLEPMPAQEVDKEGALVCGGSTFVNRGTVGCRFCGESVDKEGLLMSFWSMQRDEGTA